MTSWATLTAAVDRDARSFTGPPTGLEIDKGNDEYGWVDDELIYALSYGRYQKCRYKKHVDNFVSPWYTGVSTAVICDVENTGDSVDALIYRSPQTEDSPRIDGMYFDTMLSGSRFPDSDRGEFADRVEEECGVRPLIEPVETTTPPDLILRKD